MLFTSFVPSPSETRFWRMTVEESYAHAHWKVTTLKAEAWVAIVPDGGRRLMAAWRK